MRFDIATLFPEMCETVVNSSIIGRGIKAGKLEVHCHQIRDYTPISTAAPTCGCMAAGWVC